MTLLEPKSKWDTTDITKRTNECLDILFLLVEFSQLKLMHLSFVSTPSAYEGDIAVFLLFNCPRSAEEIPGVCLI